MDIIRIISNTRTVRNTIKRAINVTKRQIDPTTEVMLETEIIRETEVMQEIEVTAEIHQEQIMGITIDPQETEAVHPDHQAAGVDLPDHQDVDSNFCYNADD
jgi:translation elongation factor EF-Tu-like GTPase